MARLTKSSRARFSLATPILILLCVFFVVLMIIKAGKTPG